MALIEVDTGVFYDSEKPWYEQSEDCVNLGNQVISTETPISETTEPTLGGGTRKLVTVYRPTTGTGTFDFTIERHYIYDAMNPAFQTKSNQDTITVNGVI